MRKVAICIRYFVLGGLFLVCAGDATAQDVLIQGRANGVAPPAWVIERFRQDPTAFEFRRAWRGKVRRIRQARQQVGASLGPSYSSSRLVAVDAALSGTYRIPVLAGLFSDAVAPYSQAEYETRLFGDGAGSVSLGEYYAEISRGVFLMTGQVFGWIALPNPASYYEPDPLTHPRYGRVGEFIRDAVLAIDGSVDFSQFDNDGDDGVPNSGDDDGFVDTVALIYPSEAMSCGGVGPGIWPHRWTFEAWGLGTLATADASANGGFIKVSDYIIQSGLQCFGDGIMGSGTLAHEMGHALDLPDLYDTDPDDGTDSEGIGEWGLMGSGGHNKQISPAHMSAWSKDFLGWVNVTTVVANQAGVQLQPIQTTGEVLRVDVPNTNEFFLLANRQRTGSDVYLHQAGLLIWHIDQGEIAAKRFSNRVNADANHKGVDLEEADGLANLDDSANRGDPGDPFPGSNGNTVFDFASNPSSLNYVGDLSGLALRNIMHVGGVITFDISVDEIQTFVWGDVNDDDIVNSDDLDEIYWFALGWTGGNLGLMPRGDIDGDGDVDIVDGFVVHSYLDGVDTSAFRVGEIGAGTLPPLTGSTANGRTASGVFSSAARTN